MTNLTPHQTTAQFFFALGHPRRLRILDTLTRHPKGLTFEALERHARIPKSSLGHHLRFLKDAGIATRTVQDRFSIYRLNSHRLEHMLALQKDRLGYLEAA